MAQPLSGAEFSAMVTAVTSAFGDPTRRRVYLYARESGAGVTASQVAQHFSLHPNVARHHLDKLAAGGYLDVSSSRSGASVAGRPSKRYRTSGPAPVLEGAKPGEELLVTLLGERWPWYLSRPPRRWPSGWVSPTGANWRHRWL